MTHLRRELPCLHSIVLSALLHVQLYLQLQVQVPLMASLSQGLEVSAAAAPTTASLLRRLCTSNICRNGECYVIGDQTRCICPHLFKGSHCEDVDLTHVHYSIIGSVVIFQWPRPPRLKGYSFVYYQLDKPGSLIYKNKIIMSDDDQSVLVGNLREGAATYRICVEDEYIANRVLTTNSVEYLTNCIDLRTGPDYHTLAAWGLTILLCVGAVLVVYTQKDKIELLYFSGKPMAIYEKCLENGDVMKKQEETTISTREMEIRSASSQAQR